MNYRDLLVAHLAQYRREELKVAEPGTFDYQGRTIPVEHVLPRDQPWLAVPSEVREQVRTYALASGLKLHRYFHHLNSSQAFALSLFVPFFEGGQDGSGALLRALGIGAAFDKWAAESVPDPEEGTNLDAWWLTADGYQYFCEVKLTEAEFGVAVDDNRHRSKLELIYAPRLASHLKPSRLSAPEFFRSYQILRNLWHAAGTPTSKVVFLYPQQHRVLDDLLMPVLEDVTSELRDRVIVAYAEDVLARLRADELCPPHLRTYAGRLAEKYLLTSP